MMATLVGAFGGLALLLATVGVYGIMEHVGGAAPPGDRHPAGARRRTVIYLRLDSRRGLRLVAIGTAIGLVAAFATTRYIQSLLFGVDAIDPATFVAVSADPGRHRRARVPDAGTARDES